MYCPRIYSEGMRRTMKHVRGAGTRARFEPDISRIQVYNVTIRMLVCCIGYLKRLLVAQTVYR
jgi:hypothetical protein